MRQTEGQNGRDDLKEFLWKYTDSLSTWTLPCTLSAKKHGRKELQKRKKKKKRNNGGKEDVVSIV